jgi:hypothetical protein
LFNHSCAVWFATGKWVKRRFRLTRSTDFKRVRRIGRSYAHPLVVLIVASNEIQQARIGIVAGKTVGMAVERNRWLLSPAICLRQKPGSYRADVQEIR